MFMALQEKMYKLHVVTVFREPNNILGITIVGGKISRTVNNEQREKVISIFIKNIIPRSSADKNKQLQPGDKILEVNGIYLEGATHDEAVYILKNAKSPVIFLILTPISYINKVDTNCNNNIPKAPPLPPIIKYSFHPPLKKNSRLKIPNVVIESTSFSDEVHTNNISSISADLEAAEPKNRHCVRFNIAEDELTEVDLSENPSNNPSSKKQLKSNQNKVSNSIEDNNHGASSLSKKSNESPLYSIPPSSRIRLNSHDVVNFRKPRGIKPVCFVLFLKLEIRSTVDAVHLTKCQHLYKRKKMGCATGIVKYLVFIANLVFALAGLTLLIFGLLYNYEINLKGLPSDIEYAPTFSIVVGAAIFITAFMGCCGAVRESTCMLTTYSIILLSIFIIQVAIGVYAFLQVKDTGDFKNQVDKYLESTFKWYNKNNEGTEATNLIQSRLKCCGIHNSNYWQGQLPESCCDSSASVRCAPSSPSFHDQGCSVAVYNFLKDTSKTIGFVALGVAAFEIIGAIFGLCLTSSIRNSYRRNIYS